MSEEESGLTRWELPVEDAEPGERADEGRFAGLCGHRRIRSYDRRKATARKARTKRELPRRDWILLPALALMTIVLMAGSTELFARLIFRRDDDEVGKLHRVNDPSTGARGIPNCVLGKSRGRPAGRIPLQ